MARRRLQKVVTVATAKSQIRINATASVLTLRAASALASSSLSNAAGLGPTQSSSFLRQPRDDDGEEVDAVANAECCWSPNPSLPLSIHGVVVSAGKAPGSAGAIEMDDERRVPNSGRRGEEDGAANVVVPALVVEAAAGSGGGDGLRLRAAHSRCCCCCCCAVTKTPLALGDNEPNG